MVNYSSSGISGVDKLLGGGLIPGNSYLLEIEPGTEELAFIAAFLNAGWRQEELCAVILYDMPHQELVKRLSGFADVKEKLDSGALVIVDLCTEARGGAELNGSIVMTTNLSDPNSVVRVTYELSSQIEKRMKRGNFKGFRIAVLSLSSEIMNYKFEPTYRFSKTGLNIARQANATSLIVLNPKMFDETTVAAFEHLNDGILVLYMKEVKDEFERYIRVKRSPITGFSTRVVPYEIVDNEPRLAKQPNES